MKTLSVWQPWASLIVLGFKRYETRHWATRYRGPLLIHAAKTFPRQHAVLFPHLVPDPPLGALLGMVTLRDCVPTESLGGLSRAERSFGNFAPGRYAWDCSDPVLFDQPLPLRGQQGLFLYEGPLP